MKRFLTRLLDFVGSFKFITILLLFLLLVTYVGTLAQTHMGLYDVQKKYFDSYITVHQAFGKVPVILPGGYLLMILMAISLFVGGLLRMRRNKALAGVFVTHIGIAMLLLAGWVKQMYSQEGYMRLFENDSSADSLAEFQSYYDWEIAVTEVRGDADRLTEYQVDGSDFLYLDPGAQAVFRHPALPFGLAVRKAFTNCEVQPESVARSIHDGAVVDGFYLRELPRDSETSANVAGAYVTVLDTAGNALKDCILWGAQRAPLPLVVDGRQWALDMRHVRSAVPFEIQLDDFTVEMHPGTGMPRTFRSDVTLLEGEVSRPIKITMNEPLRHKGYTLYQSSWGPSGARPDSPNLFSVLAVVKNPSDQWPLYSCIVITIGLLLHFALKLRRYIKIQSMRRAS